MSKKKDEMKKYVNSLTPSETCSMFGFLSGSIVGAYGRAVDLGVHEDYKKFDPVKVATRIMSQHVLSKRKNPAREIPRKENILETLSDAAENMTDEEFTSIIIGIANEYIVGMTKTISKTRDINGNDIEGLFRVYGATKMAKEIMERSQK